MSEKTGAASPDAPPAEEPVSYQRLPWRFRARQWWGRLRRRSWLNIRVWVPFLLNPFERRRLVRFTAREFRDGLTWKIELSGGCWKCGGSGEAPAVRWKGSVRAFEYPIQIIAGASLAALVALLVGQFLPQWASTSLFLGTLCLGLAVFWAKSWNEQIEITLETCDPHRDQFPDPQIAVYDEELLLFLPSVELAREARLTIERRYRERGRAADDRHRSMTWDEEEDLR